MNTSSLGATGRSVGLASVPKDLTEEIIISTFSYRNQNLATNQDPDE